MISKFYNWCDNLTPEWVGTVIIISVYFSLFSILLMIGVLVHTYQSLLLIPAVIITLLVVYAWYIALFHQDEDQHSDDK